jgi:hypothetical protein
MPLTVACLGAALAVVSASPASAATSPPVVTRVVVTPTYVAITFAGYGGTS